VRAIGRENGLPSLPGFTKPSPPAPLPEGEGSSLQKSKVIVYLTLTIPRVMLFEAFLSFLGLRVEAPDVSWGLLANEGIKAITPVRIFWWLVVFPGLALGLTLRALNFLGDGLRDALDPRMKNR